LVYIHAVKLVILFYENKAIFVSVGYTWRTMSESLSLSIKPIKRNLWPDLEELFGSNGACGGCWCMNWKLRGKAYDEAKGYETRQMHKSIVDAGVITGLLAYWHGEVAGWVAVEPRSAYEKLAHSRVLKPVDDKEVWSITCFYVARKFRRNGIAVELIKAAVQHVSRMGGKIVEGYPVDAPKNSPAPFIFTSTTSAFQQANFKEVARHAPTRPIFRFEIE
jgi:GNAT superfamily N-acetyltransferase